MKILSALRVYGVLARFHFFHVDADRAANGHSVFIGATCEMRRIGARDQRLGWSAAGIDAGAAENLAFDDGDLPTRGYQPPCQSRSGLSGADDDRVVVRHN
jgi:hypothetical protein